MAKQPKYKLRDSDRSGFTFKEIQLVKDKGSLVGPDEFDMPPPSNKPTGGEGITLNPDARINSTSYAPLNSRVTQLVNSSNGITFLSDSDSQGKFDTNNQWFYVAGKSLVTDIACNPQISRGYQNAILTVQCVSNRIILENSNGLDDKVI